MSNVAKKVKKEGVENQVAIESLPLITELLNLITPQSLTRLISETGSGNRVPLISLFERKKTLDQAEETSRPARIVNENNFKLIQGGDDQQVESEIEDLSTSEFILFEKKKLKKLSMMIMKGKSKKVYEDAAKIIVTKRDVNIEEEVEEIDIQGKGLIVNKNQY